MIEESGRFTEKLRSSRSKGAVVFFRNGVNRYSIHNQHITNADSVSRTYRFTPGTDRSGGKKSEPHAQRHHHLLSIIIDFRGRKFYQVERIEIGFMHAVLVGQIGIKQPSPVSHT